MATRRGYRAVFISPHLDDAVFSCGGEMARLRQEGPILVLNVFTRYLADSRGAPVVLGDVRYSEENAAAAALDYEYENLGELDAFFRRPKFRSITRIFLPLGGEDQEDLKDVSKVLFDKLATIECDRIYAPLAVGWHVDHYLIFLAMRQSGLLEKVFFYEDAPYCLLEDASPIRLLQLAGEKQSLSLFLRRWWRLSRSFYRSGMVQGLKPRWKRWGAFPVASAYLLRLLLSHRTDPAGAFPLDPEPIMSDVSRFFDQKIIAANLYSSQVPEFFTGTEDMRASYLDHAARWNASPQYVERFWRPRLKVNEDPPAIRTGRRGK